MQMSPLTASVLAALSVVLGSGAAFASAEDGAAGSTVPESARTVFSLGNPQPPQPPGGEGTQAPPADETEPAKPDSPARPEVMRFGVAGSRWWTIGAGIADDFDESTDFNLFGAYSYFLETDIEFASELGLWYFDQEVQAAAGVNLTAVFRWHFINTQDWTVYTDAGIGIVVSTEEVPSGGTEFNFTPRAGVGFTKELTQSGVRLQVGLRWAHISNGRIKGNEDNPARDSAMIYFGVIIPF